MTRYCSDTRRSRISCCRNGILSMERDSSRTLHGAGLRRATRPSLPSNAITYPRGRSWVRNSLGSAGSVSVIKTTSRSARSSRLRSSNSICCLKRGSFGVSAKTTKGRAIHWNSDSVTWPASKISVWSASHCSRTFMSSAASGVAAKAAARAMFVNSFMKLDIEVALPKAKGLAQMNANNFAMTATMDRRMR